MVAEEQEGVPRVVERQFDRVYHVWSVSRRPKLPSRWDHLRPLGRSTACVGNQRMLVSRRDDPCESSVLDPRRVEEFLFADAVGEDHSLPVPVKAVVDERLSGSVSLGPGPWRSVEDQAVHEAMAGDSKI